MSNRLTAMEACASTGRWVFKKHCRNNPIGGGREDIKLGQVYK